MKHVYRKLNVTINWLSHARNELIRRWKFFTQSTLNGVTTWSLKQRFFSKFKCEAPPRRKLFVNKTRESPNTKWKWQKQALQESDVDGATLQMCLRELWYRRWSSDHFSTIKTWKITERWEIENSLVDFKLHAAISHLIPAWCVRFSLARCRNCSSSFRYAPLRENLKRWSNFVIQRDASVFQTITRCISSWALTHGALIKIFILVTNCKKRWKSLRDTFIKYYRLEVLYSTGESKRKHKKWHYYQDLLFLRSHVELFRWISRRHCPWWWWWWHLDLFRFRI